MLIEFTKEQINEYINDILQYARKTRPEYEKSAAGAPGAFRGRQKNCYSSRKMQDYIDASCEVTGQEQNLLYFQGIADCIEILRFMHIV